MQADPLPDGAARRRLELAPVEDLERKAAPDGLGLEQVLDRAGAEVVVGMKRDLVLAELQRHLRALEVVARRDLAAHLVQRVDQLLLIEVAHHVKRRIGHLASLLGPAPLSSPLRPASVRHSRYGARLGVGLGATTVIVRRTAALSRPVSGSLATRVMTLAPGTRPTAR